MNIQLYTPHRALDLSEMCSDVTHETHFHESHRYSGRLLFDALIFCMTETCVGQSLRHKNSVFQLFVIIASLTVDEARRVSCMTFKPKCQKQQRNAEKSIVNGNKMTLNSNKKKKRGYLTNVHNVTFKRKSCYLTNAKFCKQQGLLPK